MPKKKQITPETGGSPQNPPYVPGPGGWVPKINPADEEEFSKRRKEIMNEGDIPKNPGSQEPDIEEGTSPWGW